MKNMFHFLLLIAFQSTAQKNDVPKNLDILVEQVKQKVHHLMEGRALFNG